MTSANTTSSTRRRWTRAALLVLALAIPQRAFAQRADPCHDPDPPVDLEGETTDVSTDGHIGDLTLSQWMSIDWGSLNGTPFNDDLFNWLFGPGETPDPGGDDGGGGGGTDTGGTDTGVPSGYIGASYEGEMTGDPGCGGLKKFLLIHAALSSSYSGGKIGVTLAPTNVNFTMMHVPKPLPLPPWVSARFALPPGWAIAPGHHPFVGRKIQLPLVRVK